jgi:hypothetical protein
VKFSFLLGNYLKIGCERVRLPPSICQKLKRKRRYAASIPIDRVQKTLESMETIQMKRFVSFSLKFTTSVDLHISRSTPAEDL